MQTMKFFQRRTVRETFFCLLIIILLFVFSFFSEGFSKKIYDLILHLKRPVAQHPDLLLVDIDDDALSYIGTRYPWTRDKIADGLKILIEFNVKTVIYDIEFVDSSEIGFDRTKLTNEIPDTINSVFDRIKTDSHELITAFKNKILPLASSDFYLNSLKSAIDDQKTQVITKINRIVTDYDRYLGDVAGSYENVYFTVRIISEALEKKDDNKEYIIKKYSHPALIKNSHFNKGKDIEYTILDIAEYGNGLSVTNINRDEDGVVRKVDLIFELNTQDLGNRYFFQLAFNPLLDIFKIDRQKIIIKDQEYILLKNANLLDNTIKDIRIPLDKNNKMMINWPKGDFFSTFSHYSFANLLQYNYFWENLHVNLNDQRDYFGSLTDELNFWWEQRDNYFHDKTQSSLSLKEINQLRNTFLQNLETYLGDDLDKSGTGTISTIQGMIETESFTDYTKEDLQSLLELFLYIRQIKDKIKEISANIEKSVNNKICFIGYVASATTDFGVTPFSPRFQNVGVHPTVMNTILQQEFIRYVDNRWLILALMFLFSFGLKYFLYRKKPTISFIIGLSLFIVFFIVIVLIFRITLIYIDPLLPALAIILTFVTMMLYGLYLTDVDKKELRFSFSRYVSPDVVAEIEKDRSKLNLGGEERYITAVFTDVQGFSTISESFDGNPVALVSLMNDYLSNMSDIILEKKGTIDKYEGDAIIAFFNAPKEIKDHALLACYSAIEMHQIEGELNKRYLKEKMSPSPLLTRIGINTGNAVVGNMGTEKKLNYTMIGHSVNLAARLEGVNKQYGVYSLISQMTYEEVKDHVIVRLLDKVRVKGIHEPVRLYNLIGKKGEVEDKLLDAIDQFHQALGTFEKRQWKDANKAFKAVMELLPEDKPCIKYIDRCQNYIKKPPPKNWDGVYNLLEK